MTASDILRGVLDIPDDEDVTIDDLARRAEVAIRGLRAAARDVREALDQTGAHDALTSAERVWWTIGQGRELHRALTAAGAPLDTFALRRFQFLGDLISQALPAGCGGGTLMDRVREAGRMADHADHADLLAALGPVDGAETLTWGGMLREVERRTRDLAAATERCRSAETERDRADAYAAALLKDLEPAKPSGPVDFDALIADLTTRRDAAIEGRRLADVARGGM